MGKKYEMESVERELKKLIETTLRMEDEVNRLRLKN